MRHTVNPEKAAKLRQKAEELFEKGQNEKAMEHVVKSLEEHPHNPLTWQLQGLIQESSSFKSEAIKSFTEALKLDNKCETAYIGLARVYRTGRHYAKAFDALNELVKMNPASKLIRLVIEDVLENENFSEWEVLFKNYPESLIETVRHSADDIDFKFKITGLLKDVSIARPDLFKEKALDIIKEIARTPDEEIRSTAYVVLVAAYEASPGIINAMMDVVHEGIKDPSPYIQKATAGIMRSLLNYFPNYLAGKDGLVAEALEVPTIAEVLLKVLPSCPKCHKQDEVYIQPFMADDKLLRMRCEMCDIYFTKEPGAKTVSVLEKEKLSGAIICPGCKGQFLAWVENDKLYTCSVCNKFYSL